MMTRRIRDSLISQIIKMAKHIHKYHKVDLPFGKVWACALPNCNHYMPDHMKELVPGKNSLCWGCDEKIILNNENMKDSHPKCDVCSGLSEQAKNIDELLNSKGV